MVIGRICSRCGVMLREGVVFGYLSVDSDVEIDRPVRLNPDVHVNDDFLLSIDGFVRSVDRDYSIPKDRSTRNSPERISIWRVLTKIPI